MVIFFFLQILLFLTLVNFSPGIFLWEKFTIYCCDTMSSFCSLLFKSIRLVISVTHLSEPSQIFSDFNCLEVLTNELYIPYVTGDKYHNTSCKCCVQVRILSSYKFG